MHKVNKHVTLRTYFVLAYNTGFADNYVTNCSLATVVVFTESWQLTYSS